MTYTKPEINQLGDAVEMIELINGSKNTTAGEGVDANHLNPAYDLDE